MHCKWIIFDHNMEISQSVDKTNLGFHKQNRVCRKTDNDHHIEDTLQKLTLYGNGAKSSTV